MELPFIVSFIIHHLAITLNCDTLKQLIIIMDLGGVASGGSCSGLPVREISSQADLDQFLDCPTFNNFYTFIQTLSTSIEGLRLSSCPSTPSQSVLWASNLLRTLTLLLPSHPPLPTSSRFGNAAFRSWLDAARVTVPAAHDERGVPYYLEVSSYLLNSFGDYQRIDYGTGHEAHFIAWLYCLCDESTGPFFTEEDHAALILLLFTQYVDLMRQLQRTYWLEPAGSHGVWGLDDYHFLPFLFGAAQLVDHPRLRPKSIHDADIVEEYAGEYLYFSCINTINQVKTAGLRWHSPMLDDISAVRSWRKVRDGLLKMYRVEVLGKVPIMQHFLFGKILPFKSKSAGEGDEDEDGIHRHHLRGDCCGNPLPSIYAAAGTTSQDTECKHKPLHQLPFD